MHAWQVVDGYLVDTLVGEDEALRAARDSARRAGLPPAEVAPNQGKFLGLIAAMIGARRVLEFGTLFGYSTIWLARAVGADGTVVTFEVDEGYAALARENLARAAVAERVDVVVGPAVESAAALVAAQTEPFDQVFIDADKPNNPRYLAAALLLTRPGSVIIADNVVRDGRAADPTSTDDRVLGVRQFLADTAAEPRLDATAIQTVGSKGWDGFSIAVVP